MTPHPRYNAYLWLGAGAVALAATLWLFGCGGSSIQAVAVDTSECEKELAHGVLTASSCNEAQFKVDAVIATNPACKGFPPFSVCALVDGGNHGDH